MKLHKSSKNTKSHDNLAEIPQSAFEDDDEVIAPKIPRYLQLARAIHARFTADEEKEKAIFREAEALVARKNEVIMRAVQEVLDFCAMLREVPELTAALDQKTDDITQRLYSNRATYTVEHEPIAVVYEAPLYSVDMRKPEHISLSRVDNAYLQVSFNPVKFELCRSESESNSTVTQHLLSKHYRLDSGGTFLHFQSRDGAPADPIADIITELRARLGHDFFEKNLMPYFEAHAQPAE
ncbi:MAG: hypothetical protein K2X09_08130 [Rickettsiales bacterium]|nr:hypothetical protein [Rickettsiales bacterium]